MKKKKPTKIKQRNPPVLKRKKISVDEKEFLEALDKISKKLIYQFKFGYHEIEDMKQQASLFAIEGLKNYDHSRPLENFLWTHVRNRLFNYKRDNYQRPDKPCLTCPLYDKFFKKSENQCVGFLNKNDCSLLTSWENKNTTKKNIMRPLEIEVIAEGESQEGVDFIEQMKNKELFKKIDENIPIRLRQTYLSLLSGQKISKKDNLLLIEYIREILNIPKKENQDE